MLKVIVPSIIGLFLAGSSLASGDVTYPQRHPPLWNAKCSTCHGAESPYLGDFLENQDKYKKMMKGRAWIPMRT